MIDDVALRQGRRRLRDLLPAARVQAKHIHKIEATSLGEATFSNLTEDKFDALVVHEAERGGWHADLVLRDVPPGFPNVVGSAVERPFRTREDAEREAVGVLAAMLAQCAKPRTKPVSQDRVFLLDGFTIILPAKVYNLALQMIPEADTDSFDRLGAVLRIEAVLAEVLPNGISEAHLLGLSRGDYATLLAALMRATFAGVFAYPLRVARPPAPAGQDASP